MGRWNLRQLVGVMASASLWFMRGFARSDRGNVATMVALLIVPVAAVLSLAGEVSGWYAIQRAAQNAADSAAIAAASNGDPNSYQSEAKSVAAYMSFVDGQHSTTVSAAPSMCPTISLSECYKVTITKNVSIYLTQLVGYKGSGGNGTQTITASALAGTKNITQPVCLLALASSGTTITVNGGPNVDMTNCSIATRSTSNNPVKCTGNWNFPAAVAPSTASCGTAKQYGNSRAVDNYAGYGASYIPNSNGVPTDPCGGTYKGVTWAAAPSSYTPVCGTLTIQKNATVTLTTSGTIYIYNGQLDLNGGTLATANGAQVTIVFVRVSGSNYAPFAGSSGMLNIQAPTSGNWSGVALYQYNLTNTVSQTFSGSNSVQWDITGLIYMPEVDLQFNGAVNKSTYGAACTVLIVDTFKVNGSDAITFNQKPNACPVAGLNNPPVIITSSYVALAG